jgi:hypothetical protein
MQENDVRHLLVIDEDILIGVIGMDDLAQPADHLAAQALGRAEGSAAAAATL